MSALGLGILPFADTDRPDEEDPEVLRIAADLGVDPKFLADTTEETVIGIFFKTGERPPLEDALAALHVAGHEMKAKADKNIVKEGQSGRVKGLAKQRR